jgi:DNA-directed RNA polymerase, mitochondrial
MLQNMQVAKAHEHYAALHFPHNLDFRGRAYPMSPHLSHMGSDLCRGILTFADARPLGDSGFRWLLIHLANLYGVVDKQSFDERVSWALENLPEVLDSATKPLGGGRWWLRSDAPWATLASCFEIKAALDSGDVTMFMSRLPVHQDGSCNGLQHYAAIGRDVAGAHAVCLLDGPSPEDVYSSITRVVADSVRADMAGQSDTQVLLPPLKGADFGLHALVHQPRTPA